MRATPRYQDSARSHIVQFGEYASRPARRSKYIIRKNIIAQLRDQISYLLIHRVAKKRKSCILKPEHIDFLISEESLRPWSGFSLRDRVGLFHRRFIDAKITPSQLRTLYCKFGIKKKKVRMVKPAINLSKEKWPTTPESILDQLDKAR